MEFAVKSDYEIQRNGEIISVEKASKSLRKFGKKFVFDVSANIEKGDVLTGIETKTQYDVISVEIRNEISECKKLVGYKEK